MYEGKEDWVGGGGEGVGGEGVLSVSGKDRESKQFKKERLQDVRKKKTEREIEI